MPFVHANGAAIPAIGLGTWAARDEDCIQAVSWALEAGYRHIDTAAAYENEHAVGQALRASGLPRSDLFVTTKVWYTDIADGSLQKSAEASLRRLGLDHVDLLLIHWPNQAIPLRDSMRALCDAKRKGLTRHIGVSNFPVALLEEAVAVADEPLVANQCEYQPRLDQSKVLEACRRHGLAFTSYSPIGRGELLGEPAIRRIAEQHGRTPAQIVLRWHVQQPGVIAIPKSANRRRIAENIALFDFALSDEEMAAISSLARPDGRMIDPAWAPRWDAVA
ncbi:aldo/keto reductase [Chelatococcus sp. SYSU_G07232]|uniref:Aldo/keto reductase n=1 Tax=Chelatococcus albus TaxID=3047466 RepID=A0ABT7ACZ8_9HYPH|nr:aldo/keto reductase [Chelatococcus sp. SYSU_G07232]MDJ1157243.1 aldo/keto reductase [Chelatococcus sp. SYSU_G07232]